MNDMALTKNYKDTLRNKIKGDLTFRQGLLEEAIECLFSGEVDVGRNILKEFIKATVGFEALGTHLNKKPESLIRMFSPSGNPTVKNFFQVIAFLQKQEGQTFGLKFGG
jgi:hypothetical protein